MNDRLKKVEYPQTFLLVLGVLCCGISDVNAFLSLIGGIFMYVVCEVLRRPESS